MIAFAFIVLGMVVTWYFMRKMRAKQLHELSREKKVIILSLHAVKPKPFRPLGFDLVRLSGSKEPDRSKE
tara:strand:+ start:422 stop:631 length:210 start_codon:yes stop_codon:yes gene_type:complete